MTRPTPMFGGWTPTYEGDPCMGGHPPQAVREGRCGRCSRAVDERRCLCGDPSHRGGLSRSMCPTRMRFDQRDAQEHWPWILETVEAFGDVTAAFRAVVETQLLGPDGGAS